MLRGSEAFCCFRLSKGEAYGCSSAGILGFPLAAWSLPLRSPNSPSVAVRFAASAFPRLLMLGLVTTALVLMVQQTRLQQPSQASTPYF